MPLSDVGDWSLYNYAGHESSSDYHELLREFFQSMCSRRLGEVYCTYAKRYRGYQVNPPVLDLDVPELTMKGQLTVIRFSVSKLSAVEVTISKGDKVAFDRVATFRRGGDVPLAPALARPLHRSPGRQGAAHGPWTEGTRQRRLEVSRLPERRMGGAMAPRIILYTGKGGVGKTSVAAATARRCAAAGLRTVVLSTDPAHSLSDSLEAPLGGDPTEVGHNLFGQEVQAQVEMERHWEGVQEWLGDLLAQRGVDRISAEELTVPPGMDELFSLLWIKRHHEEAEFDCVVVDCAPTGETLRLLSFPDVVTWWLERCCPGSGGWRRWLAPCSTCRCRVTPCSTTSSAWRATWWR